MKCLLFIRLRFTTITNCNLQICSDNRAYLVRKQEQKRGMIVLDQTNANIERHIKTHTESSDDDRAAVSALETFLRSNGRINPSFASDVK